VAYAARSRVRRLCGGRAPIRRPEREQCVEEEMRIRNRQAGTGRGAALKLVGAAVVALVAVGDAHGQFYIGPAYLQVPGLASGEARSRYKDWVRTESRYWGAHPALPEIRGINSDKNDLLFTGPVAPASGPSVLAFAVDKKSPALPGLLERCHSGATIPQVRFAESSEIGRHPQEYGPRPKDVPEFFEYVLKNVRLACPAVAGAPEQAFRATFDQIEWVNYRPQPKPRAITAEPAKLAPPALSGESKVFVISWFAAAVDARDDQCPRMNTKASQDDYYALMPKAQADQMRAKLASEGGVADTRIAWRGPDQMNVALLPGIVADPGFVAPVSDVAEGFDLDGDDGSGAPPPGVRKHKNFRSPDGRTGIDNQLFTVEGCVEGLRRKGFLPMIFNEGRAAGRQTALVAITGIDDDRNDDDVTVTLLYSEDGLRRSPSKVVLPDYTFRVSDSPQFTQSFARFHGRIVDGVVVTDPIAKVHVHEVTGIETTLYSPRLRIRFLPDGRMKGVIGGYLDWRKRYVFDVYRGGQYENTVGLQSPAIYNAIKRAADGLQDKETGEFDGISAAFDIEGVPAFIPPSQQKQLFGGQSQIASRGR
jgi:hypothetical protein